MSDTTERDEKIIAERITGKSVSAIARQFGVSPNTVNAVLDHHAQAMINNQFRVRTLGLELSRLDELQSVFHKQALEGDVPSGALIVRIQERRATLLGLNAPVRVDPVAMTEAAQPQMTSTERIQAAIDRLCL